MTAIQYLNVFRVYGADVLLLALGVTLVCALLKKTALKNAPKKLYVVLPFALGLIFFAAYRMIAELSWEPITDTFARTLEGGFACGCAATLYYVVYEQFFRKKHAAAEESGADSTENEQQEPLHTDASALPLLALLEGFLPAGSQAQAAEEMISGSKGKSGEELSLFVEETLRRFALPDLPETQLRTLRDLIAAYLGVLNGLR